MESCSLFDAQLFGRAGQVGKISSGRLDKWIEGGAEAVALVASGKGDKRAVQGEVRRLIAGRGRGKPEATRSHVLDQFRHGAAGSGVGAVKQPRGAGRPDHPQRAVQAVEKALTFEIEAAVDFLAKEFAAQLIPEGPHAL